MSERTQPAVAERPVMVIKTAAGLVPAVTKSAPAADGTGATWDERYE